MPRCIQSALAMVLSLAGCGIQDRSTQVPPPAPESNIPSTSSIPAAAPAAAAETQSRQKMVLEQITAPGRDIRNPRVIDALLKVPRHLFVPAAQRSHAYGDYPLPIGHGQTISQPYIVAFMTEILDPKPSDKILEIGTGSGYQAAVMAELVGHVYTIEIIEPLARTAESVLRQLNYTNVTVKAGDGYQGWAEHALFDAIIVTCAPQAVPKPLTEQLREGGRMIIPVGPPHDQELYLLEKRGGAIRQRAVLPVRFVPMTGDAAQRQRRAP